MLVSEEVQFEITHQTFSQVGLELSLQVVDQPIEELLLIVVQFIGRRGLPTRPFETAVQLLQQLVGFHTILRVYLRPKLKIEVILDHSSSQQLHFPLSVSRKLLMEPYSLLLNLSMSMSLELSNQRLYPLLAVRQFNTYLFEQSKVFMNKSLVHLLGLLFEGVSFFIKHVFLYLSLKLLLNLLLFFIK